jgi:metal iron transporter
MPHNLYLGSGVVQARLHEFDVKEGNLPARPTSFSSSTVDLKYRPSLAAIRNCMGYSIAELVIALLTFAFFVNSAILITAGASLSGNGSMLGSDLFGIHNLLAEAIAPAAGTIFAVSLLLSGTSAGVVATIAGQMVSEGSLNWTCAPWLRRLLTRLLSITPSIIIAGAVGRDGLSAALNGSQIALSVILPFVSAPLIYFTCRNKYMTVSTADGGDVKMRNHWFTAVLAVIIWLIIVIMNVSLLILFALGKICSIHGCLGQLEA